MRTQHIHHSCVWPGTNKTPITSPLWLWMLVRSVPIPSFVYCAILHYIFFLRRQLRISYSDWKGGSKCVIYCYLFHYPYLCVCQVIILDVRVPCTPVARLNNHRACVNGIAWAPHSSVHICTAGKSSVSHFLDIIIVYCSQTLASLLSLFCPTH